ncbi:hypothetical protein FG386_002331 [Cryptosporidium ryanae]|uniref:uncharacterized protein n=1 Tax=Cryptosporidium ryanae TaxID=515981 RepID=UPI00351A0C5F|nr:hypothetical protein FG386_002331 [Cryptosporidium ryanae]
MSKEGRLFLSFEKNKTKNSDTNDRRKVDKLFSQDELDLDDTNSNKAPNAVNFSTDKYSNQNEYKKSEEFYKNHPELLLEFEEGKEYHGDNIEAVKASDEKAKSKYMNKIQEYVNLRNIEKQEINEEKIQKEIHVENNDMVFITSSYKNVLKEREALKRKLSKSLSCDTGNFDKNIFNMRFNNDFNTKSETEVEDNTFEKTIENKTSSKSNVNLKIYDDLKNSSTSSPSITHEDISYSNDVTELNKVEKASDDKNFEDSNDDVDVNVKILKARERYILRKQARSANLKKKALL